MVPPSGAILLAATPLDPPVDGKGWSFHFVNDSTERIESVILEAVDREWRDTGDCTFPKTRFGPVAPGTSQKIWKDDDGVTELRISIVLLIRGERGERRITGDFGKLYRAKRVAMIPILGKEGVLGTTAAGPPREPALRAWRVTQGFVVEHGRSPISVIYGLQYELPEGPWRELHDYARLDAQGKVREEFRLSFWSIEEELGVSIFAVVDGELRKLIVRAFYVSEFRVQREETTVLSDLREVPDDDAETRFFLQAALAGHRQLLKDRALRVAQETDARVAAIPGAEEEHGVGDDFRRAQKILQDSVRSYGQSLDGTLLRILSQFGIVHRSLRPRIPSAFVSALDAFVLGCRRAASDRTLGSEDVLPAAAQDSGEFVGLSSRRQAELCALVESLSTVHQQLLESAEARELSDARLGAIEFQMAADHIARAREHLERGLRRPG
jgi:hypothetical protein